MIAKLNTNQQIIHIFKMSSKVFINFQCNKLEVITELWWTCNGKRMEAGKENVKIRNKSE